MSSYIAGTVLLLLVIYPTVCFALVCGKLPIFSWNVIVPAEFSKAFGLPFQLTFPCDITRCNLDKNMKQSFGNAITGTADPSQEQGEIDNLIIDMFNKAGEGLDFNDSLQSLESALEGKDAATIETLVVNALEGSIISEMERAIQSEIQSNSLQSLESALEGKDAATIETLVVNALEGSIISEMERAIQSEIQSGMQEEKSDMQKAIEQELKFKDKLFEYATYPSIGLYGLAIVFFLLSSFGFGGKPIWVGLWRSTIVLAVISNLAFCSMLGLYIIGARDKLKKHPAIGEERLKMFKLKVSPLFVNLCVAPALLLAFGLVYLCVGAPIEPMIVHAQKSEMYKRLLGRQTANPADATKTPNEHTPLLSGYVTESSK